MRAALRERLAGLRRALASEEGQLADSPLMLLLVTGATLAGLTAMALIAALFFKALAQAVS